MKKGTLFTAIAYVGVWLLVGAYWLYGQTTESPLWIVIATLCMTMPLIATIILQRIEKEPVYVAFASGGSPIDGGLSLGYYLHYLQLQQWAYPVFCLECTSPQRAH